MPLLAGLLVLALGPSAAAQDVVYPAPADVSAPATAPMTADPDDFTVPLHPTPSEPSKQQRLQDDCDARNMVSCFNLAVGMGRGEFGAASPYHAAFLYRRACEGGVTDSCFNLAIMHQNGSLGQPDHHEAARLYTMTCDSDPTACGALADIHHQGLAGTADLKRALPLYDRACAAGHTPSCLKLAAIQLTEHDTPDVLQAAVLFRDACQSGDPVGCYQLGALYQGQLISDPSGAHAKAMFEAACEGGYSDACRLTH